MTEGYLTIQSWMRNGLDLRGNDLLVFAIIYGFSQDGQTSFKGSLQYLADWCGSTKQGVQKNLKTLIEKGYIRKEERYVNGLKFCDYSAAVDARSCMVCNSVARGIQLSCTHNIEDNIDNNVLLYEYNNTCAAQGADRENTNNPAAPVRNRDTRNYSDGFEKVWNIYPRKKNKGKAYECYRARLNSGWSEEELYNATEAYAIECRRNHTDEKYIKMASTFFSASTPFTDYLNTEVQTNTVDDNDPFKDFV